MDTERRVHLMRPLPWIYCQGRVQLFPLEFLFTGIDSEIIKLIGHWYSDDII